MYKTCVAAPAPSGPDDAIGLIVEHIRDRHGPRGADLNGKRIAEVIGQLVSSGELRPGEKLPTVRSLSRELRVSPGTVSDAWRVLRAHSVISTDRRRGTIIRSTKGDVQGRYWNVPVAPGTLEHDLTTGTPDPGLLPALAPALARVQLETEVTSYLDRPVVEALEDLLRGSWPFDPERLTIVDGAQDGLDRIVSSLVSLGDAVIVEDPTFPPIIDMLELAGAQLIPVGTDAEGVRPEEMQRALAAGPVAAFVQPRAQNPTGATFTAARRDELAALLDGSGVLVVEDDHSGPITGVPLHSLGSVLPEQVLHIRSFSKSHGPDLRLAALGGPATMLDPVIQRRHLGPSWTSRLLQRVLFELLQDETAVDQISKAAGEYADRRQRFVAALVGAGMTVDDGVGMNVWVPVANEQRAVVALAAHGIGVAPGRPFMVEPSDQDFIRVTIASVSDEVEQLASAIARAAAES